MKTLVTNSEHTVLYKRKFLSTKVYLRITDMNLSVNGILVKGHYYIKTEADPYYILDEIFPSILTWNQLSEVEFRLDKIRDNTYFKNVVMQRLTELTFLKLKLEGKSNYGIPSNDWIEYVEENN
uniref:Uncharacterized protein n=1 Tax=Siphoviridae sp. ctDOT22 TaxID=2827812 RepID=A0A8S5SWF4_9CAUD|nr:MAG TPA: hypothetical protein [Siphoviridae sp. ctDOT22]